MTIVTLHKPSPYLILYHLFVIMQLQLIIERRDGLLGWAVVLHRVLLRVFRRFVHPRLVDGFSPSWPRAEMTMYPRLLTPGSLLAAVSGCGDDFEDLHNLSLLAVGFIVTPAITSDLVPWYGLVLFQSVAAAICKQKLCFYLLWPEFRGFWGYWLPK